MLSADTMPGRTCEFRPPAPEPAEACEPTDCAPAAPEAPKAGESRFAARDTIGVRPSLLCDFEWLPPIALPVEDLEPADREPLPSAGRDACCAPTAVTSSSGGL